MTAARIGYRTINAGAATLMPIISDPSPAVGFHTQRFQGEGGGANRTGKWVALRFGNGLLFFSGVTWFT
jgi:hypothetical protein